MNLTHSIRKREIESDVGKVFQRKQHVTRNLITRLGLIKDLDGHIGCVNCIEWNETGTLLASGSDDMRICLWDPFRYRKLHTVQTGHLGNIFVVKFLPRTRDQLIVSSGADCRIRVHDIVAQETTYLCTCHSGRVKRIATAPNIPYLFWSASEDGTVMEFDMRVPHQCASECNNVLINLLNHAGRHIECKCVSVNPYRPELLALGANDPYVRLYDRRMITLSSIRYPSDNIPRTNWERHNFKASQAGEGSDSDHLPPGCVKYFTAGHLPVKQAEFKKKYRTLVSTYVTFGPTGNELLVNLGGEQIYLFDIHSLKKTQGFDIHCPPCHDLAVVDKSKQANGCTHSTNGIGLSSNGGIFHRSKSSLDSRDRNLSSKAMLLKAEANHYFENNKFTLAINVYNEAILLCPNAAVLYGNRAAALMKRGWDGDIYAAMRDCIHALRLEPNHLKAHFRLARCLHELNWTEEASQCLHLFRIKYPEHTNRNAYINLDKDINSGPRGDRNLSRDFSETEEEGEEEKENKSSRMSCQISQQEKLWRAQAYDYESRYCGHCNTTTDIKEANFFGSNGQYIVAGSDDGSFFIWDRVTSNIVRILKGDESIVNCLQPHPTLCLLATSGIDKVVRLWAPLPEDGLRNDREVTDTDVAASANQIRMNSDPLEVMLFNMGYRITPLPNIEDGPSSDEGGSTTAIQCRPS